MDDDAQNLGNSASPTDGRGRLHVLSAGGNGFLSGVDFDEIDVTYPSSVVEIFTYKLATVTQMIITVTYTDSTKDFIESVVKT